MQKPEEKVPETMPRKLLSLTYSCPQESEIWYSIDMIIWLPPLVLNYIQKEVIKAGASCSFICKDYEQVLVEERVSALDCGRCS